jgi:hypothetical protein
MDNNGFLDELQIASPCRQDWENMSGDERVRFCQQCQLSVYNISEMSKREAEKLIAEREGRLCIRMFRRHDGTVITQDCPVALRKLKEAARRVGSIAASVVSLLLSATSFAKAEPNNNNSNQQSCGAKSGSSSGSKSDPNAGHNQPKVHHLMGKIAVPHNSSNPPQTSGNPQGQTQPPPHAEMGDVAFPARAPSSNALPNSNGENANGSNQPDSNTSHGAIGSQVGGQMLMGAPAPIRPIKPQPAKAIKIRSTESK